MIDQCNNGILFDYARMARIGLPEAVFCAGKSLESLQNLIAEKTEQPRLFTRLCPQIFQQLPSHLQNSLTYHPLSQTAYTHSFAPENKGQVCIISAGTSDAPTTWEAAKTLEYLGISHTVFEDCGVAGLWRLTEKLEDINKAHVIIAVAGLDAALVSVLGGLTSKPLIAVPTATGYGMAKNGKTALASMLVTCAPGVSVMNIGNGYGAACAATRILHLL